METRLVFLQIFRRSRSFLKAACVCLSLFQAHGAQALTEEDVVAYLVWGLENFGSSTDKLYARRVAEGVHVVYFQNPNKAICTSGREDRRDEKCTLLPPILETQYIVKKIFLCDYLLIEADQTGIGAVPVRLNLRKAQWLEFNSADWLGREYPGATLTLASGRNLICPLQVEELGVLPCEDKLRHQRFDSRNARSEDVIQKVKLFREKFCRGL